MNLVNIINNKNLIFLSFFFLEKSNWGKSIQEELYKKIYNQISSF
jgi:hypothetical protein